MLRIIVELVPSGREAHKRELALMQLGNVSSLNSISDYAIFATEDVNVLAQRGRWESRGMITGHERYQTVWALVERGAKWATAEAEKR
jgi:hypothetical protein